MIIQEYDSIPKDLPEGSILDGGTWSYIQVCGQLISKHFLDNPSLYSSIPVWDDEYVPSGCQVVIKNSPNVEYQEIVDSFLSYQEEQKALDANATSWKAIFALQEQWGGREEPSLEYWILRSNQRWHDIVRGDGHSYQTGGPGSLVSLPGETREEFAKRAGQAAREWEAVR